MTVETALELPPDAAAVQQANGTNAATLPKRSKTRQGKARLLTLSTPALRPDHQLLHEEGVDTQVELGHPVYARSTRSS
jgi:hypothetical protein